MKLDLRALFGCLLCWTAFSCFASDDYKDASELERTGNLWKKGEPIPAKLLEYRASWDKGSCFPIPGGTEMLFQGITNYSLLREVIFLPQIDAQVFSNSVNSAITLVGPTRFFSDSMEILATRPELARQDRFKALKKQSTIKHIVIDSLYITFADMAPDEAKKVLNQIAAELQTGKTWHDVFWKYLEAYESSYDDKSSDGTIIRRKRSKIGNLGDFVLAANGNPLFSYREDWMPKGNIKKQFTAKVGDILILSDKEDLSSFPDLNEKATGERFVLYKIREVYDGKASKP